MPSDLIDFVWRVPAAGFQWVTAEHIALDIRDGTIEIAETRRPRKAKPTPRQTKPAPQQTSPERYLAYASAEPVQRARPYLPFVSYTGLFKLFAETEPTEPGILAFANQFGCLGGKIRSGPLSVATGSHRLQGEALGRWQEAIRTMQDILLIWESAKAAKLSALHPQIFWKGNAVFHQSLDGQKLEVIASEQMDPEILARFTPGDLCLPAMYAVQRHLNRELAEHTAAPKLLWDKDNGQLVLRQSATSLIGALWLQFAKAVEGNKQYLQCENCREWIEVGGRRGARSDKRFCSPSCKSAAHQRKARLNAATEGR